MPSEVVSELAELEIRLGIEFHDPQLLKIALVHPSLVNEKGIDRNQCNQRLEFLGDALIDLAVAEELYRRHPDWTEGRLTAARAGLVNDETLAEIAAAMEIGNFLLMGRGETAGGGRARPSNLADALEAIVGAVLLDAGYQTASSLTLRLLADRIDYAGRASELNPKSKLQELVQRRSLKTPVYRTVETAGDPHTPSFHVEVMVDGRVVGTGFGPRKAIAEQEAASKALAEFL